MACQSVYPTSMSAHFYEYLPFRRYELKISICETNHVKIFTFVKHINWCHRYLIFWFYVMNWLPLALIITFKYYCVSITVSNCQSMGVAIISHGSNCAIIYHLKSKLFDKVCPTKHDGVYLSWTCAYGDKLLTRASIVGTGSTREEIHLALVYLLFAIELC